MTNTCLRLNYERTCAAVPRDHRTERALDGREGHEGAAETGPPDRETDSRASSDGQLAAAVALQTGQTNRANRASQTDSTADRAPVAPSHDLPGTQEAWLPRVPGEAWSARGPPPGAL